MGGEANILSKEFHDRQTVTPPHNCADFNISWNPGSAAGVCLKNVFYQIESAATVTVKLYANINGVRYLIDTVGGANSYVFPNARVPSSLALDGRTKLEFVTSGIGITDAHHVCLVVAELSGF